jgi:hypothetical protein
MAIPTTEKTNYPVINVSAWRTLRKKFQENPPKAAVNASYLATVLCYNKVTATALIAQLKRVGLIDNEAKLTERAFRWRDDTKYKAVCEEILDEVYPQEVRDLFHSADAPREDVGRWFAAATKSGSGTASNYARFYVMLLEGDPEKLDSTPSPKPKAAGTKTGKSKSRSNGVNVQPALFTTAETHASGKVNGSDGHETEHHHATTRRTAHSIEPSLNINVQIHIPAEATPDQIDQIFKSMAKHLYQRHDEADE